MVDQELLEVMANSKQAFEKKIEEAQAFEFRELKRKNKMVNKIFNIA